MKLDPLRRRLSAMLMVFAILVAGAPLLPASAADCGHAAMATSPSMPMMMNMKSMPAKSAPAKPSMPCSGMGLNCVAGSCAVPSAVDQSGVAFLPPIGSASVAWATQVAGSSIAHKPVLPPPIASV